MASAPKAADRLRENVLGESFDWAYVECNLDPGEPDLRDDVAAVLQRLEELEAENQRLREQLPPDVLLRKVIARKEVD